MKKNSENNVSENVVVMDQETMEAIIEDNMHLVPKNQMKKFNAMTLEQKVKKIQFYTDMAVMREQARIKNSVVNRKMSDSQGDRLIEEQQTRLKELDNAMLKYEEDRKQLQTQLNNLQNNIEDYNNVSEEQKNRIIRECVKRVDIEKDGITSVGKYIEIYMIDGSKHTVHMTKRGNYFNTAVIHKGEERPLDDFKIITRFVRKKY